ncbi:MAG TPA: HD domain-containing phosphohydrolase [Bryobacteraceae bacterium]|nr:HD domain-containing phosphohydrolase [Bryobacteraceae bacterium]
MSQAATQFARRLVGQAHLLGYIGLGVAALLWSVANWDTSDPVRLISFAIATALGSVLKLQLPGVRGMVSVSVLFILVGIVNLSLPEAIWVGALSMLVQCTWRTTARPKLKQTAFNISVLVIAVLVAAKVFEYSRGRFPEPVSLGLLALGYFCANTFPIAAIIGLTEGKRIFSVWSNYRWTLAYYAVGASMAWVIGTLPHSIQWEFPIICLPLVYLVHRSNRTHLTQMEHERKHMQAINGLHLRTIEALALAIDAKDHTTHDHLQRVQLYAVEIGKDLGVSPQELEALTAAAVLHDIGKLAVPESIISKPGKLTRSEFEKMKIHPVVGAEILERVEFPYPVVPIVRSHHEKWDGSGYPYGLRGEEIPIGARILSVVDCLDALASDRQYRRALPLDEAMAKVASEAGTAFDPRVVRALQARYQELEARAKISEVPPQPPLSVDIKITRGAAPAAGFEAEAPAPAPAPRHPVAQARANRRNEGDSLPDMPAAGLCSLQWEEALTVASLRIRRIVSYDAIALFTCEDDFVRSTFVSGEDAAELESLTVRQGEGLVGWVAEVGKPILNGNPTVEPGYAKREGTAGLSSALALPLVSTGRVVGVVALYRRERDAFAAEELVSLLELCPALASLMLDADQPVKNLLEMANAVQGDGHSLVRT